MNDQAKALRFYTDVLGFVKKADYTQRAVPVAHRCVTEEPDGIELQLAPNDNPAARAYQQALFEQGQPAVMFFVDDVQREYDRLKALGRGVHHAADQGDRLDHRHAERHLRQSGPDRRARPLAGLTARMGPVSDSTDFRHTTSNPRHDMARTANARFTVTGWDEAAVQ